MKRRLTSVAAGVATLVATGGLVFVGAGVASAAAPTYIPDPNSVGTLTFYDASGHVITGGTLPSDTTTTQPFAAYVVGSTNVHGTDTRSNLFYASPTTADPSLWTTEAIGGITTFSPRPSGEPTPVNLTGLPVWKGSASDNTLFQFSDPTDGFPTSRAADPNVYQIRMYTNNPSAQGSAYDEADVTVDRTNHTWTQVFPATATTTASAPTASIASPQTTPASAITLTSTVTPATVPGTVTFFDGSTPVGAVKTVSGGSATSDSFVPTLGSHSYTARFDPAPGTSITGLSGTGQPTTTTTEYKDSTSSATPYTVQAPADAVRIVIGDTHGASVTDPGSATATLTDTSVPATTVTGGTVQFYYSNDGGTTRAPLGSPQPVSGGAASLSLPGGFPIPSGAGPFTYIIEGVYSGVPSSFSAVDSHTESPTGDAASFSLTAPTTSPICSTEPNADTTGTGLGQAAAPGASCTDQQTITATIPAGILTITTPYTAANPLNLGTLALASDGSKYSTPTGGVSFGDATNGYIRVTDTRAGRPLNWTANVNAGNLACSTSATCGSGTINAQNVGLLLPSVVSDTATTTSGFNTASANLALSANPTTGGPYAPGATGTDGIGNGPHQFAKTNIDGAGTVDLTAKMTLIAPTTTQAGTYTGTVTFTVG